MLAQPVWGVGESRRSSTAALGLDGRVGPVTVAVPESVVLLVEAV